MNVKDYKYVKINKVSIAYTEHGEGTPVLFVHGFASFSFSWMKLIECLPSGFRYITIDLKGYGYSEKKCDAHLAIYDQAIILAAFIRRMHLHDVVLVGHSMGGIISLVALFNAKVRALVSRLVLIDSAGMFLKLPDFIDDLAAISPQNVLLKFAQEDLMAAMVLREAYHDESKITPAVVKEYADILRQPNAKECLISAAKQISIANQRYLIDNLHHLDLPKLIIWGENDRIISVEDAFLFLHELPNAELKIIPDCGHSPQEEKPEIIAGLIREFLNIPPGEFVPLSETLPHELNNSEAVNNKNIVPSAVDQIVKSSAQYIDRLKMRRLVDRWSLGTFFFMLIIKLLQFFKKMGFHAEENGWRRATGVFLRNEYSKFILASFRLNYAGKNTIPVNIESAKALLIPRLISFISINPACHWTLDWGYLMVKRKKLLVTDIIEGQFNRSGELDNLVLYFDSHASPSSMLNDALVKSTVKEFCRIYNLLNSVSGHSRARILQKRILSWIQQQKNIHSAAKSELNHLIERVLNGTFIQFETLPPSEDSQIFLRARMATPNLKARRHPGFGLLNIICRFTHDFSESDLWFQHHHVPVDGMPMQEMLRNLKSEWGECGSVFYPALHSPAAHPEVFYFGNKIFRARIYVNFEIFIKLRRYLNSHYQSEMGGQASIASLVIWGLAQYDYFKERKFLFPVDSSTLSECPHERNISLIFIRPGKFFDSKNPLHGFLNYQKEFNRRMFTTRIGKSESSELLELYAMIHPLFYHLMRLFFPKSLNEILGTAGVTILKDAEMFVSPLTDIQLNGFIALGNLMMPTEDGGFSGAVSICGSKEQVKEYIKAIYAMVDKYPEYLNIHRESFASHKN